MLKRIAYLLSVMLVVGGLVGVQAQQQRATDVLMVLPFENTSNKPEFNWVGESFALSLSELLRVPGLNVVSNSERKVIQQGLRIPLTNLPSLAASLKLAQRSGATLLISGKYNIVPAQGDTAATLNLTAKIVRVNEGRFLSEVVDGRQIQRDIILNDALGNLQTMQGQVAYQILYQRDKALPFSQNQLIESANKVPARAFEAYIKGLLTPAAEARENYFRNAMRLYQEVTPDGTFADAALELGHLYLGQRKFSEAVDSFERVVNTNQQCKERAKNDNKIPHCNDESFAEASFYIGLIKWQQGNYEQALGVLRPLAEDLVLRIGRAGEFFGRLLVILNRLQHQRVVVGLALFARLPQVIVAVPEEEIGLTRLLRLRGGLNRLLVELRGSLVILCLVGLVGGLVRLARLQLTDLATPRRKRPQGQHRDRRQRCTRQRTH